MTFQRAQYCPAPPGDSITRKSLFDSLVAGCVPVLFAKASLRQYLWYFTEEEVGNIPIYSYTYCIMHTVSIIYYTYIVLTYSICATVFILHCRSRKCLSSSLSSRCRRVGSTSWRCCAPSLRSSCCANRKLSSELHRDYSTLWYVLLLLLYYYYYYGYCLIVICTLLTTVYAMLIDSIFLLSHCWVGSGAYWERHRWAHLGISSARRRRRADGAHPGSPHYRAHQRVQRGGAHTTEVHAERHHAKPRRLYR